MTDQEKIMKVLELSFRIENSTFYHQSNCNTVKVYVINDDCSEHLFDAYGYYGETGRQIKSQNIDVLIEKLEEYIKSKGE